MGSVLHLTDTYLPITQTFIYDEVKYLKNFKPIFLVSKIENHNVFPFPKNQIYKMHYFILKNKFYYMSNPIKEKVFNTIKPVLDIILWPIVKTKLKKIIEKNNVKLIHCHFGTNAEGFLRLKKAFNLPLVTFFYGYDVSFVEKNRESIYYKNVFKEGDCFLTESEFLAKKLRNMGCPNDKLIVLKQGIDLDDFEYKLRKPENKIKILTVGRFVEKKGIKYAIKAFAKSLQTYPNIELRIMGDGIKRPQIEALIDKLGIKDNVFLLGFQPYSVLMEEMKNCHIFMLPSVTAADGDTEGQGTVFLQAQAVGVPVLSTFHNGIPEGVINGKTGYLVEERNSDALSEKLNLLLENPDSWEVMGKAGRENVEENFEVKKQTVKLEKIYADLI